MWRRVGQIVAWLVILVTAAVLVTAVVVPRLTGATPYTVLTGSMQPGLPPGTLLIVRPTPAEEIGIGDVVTYQLTSGEPTVVTHRVISVGVDGTGSRVLRTQGDANSAPDPEPVRPVQVRGEVWYSVPHLGWVNNMLTGGQRQVAVYLVAASLLGYTAFLWAGALRDGIRRRQNEGEEEDAGTTYAPTAPQ